MWGAWGKNREQTKKKALIPKGEPCLEIETTSSGPTRFGYLCRDHAEEFAEGLTEAMENLRNTL